MEKKMRSIFFPVRAVLVMLFFSSGLSLSNAAIPDDELQTIDIVMGLSLAPAAPAAPAVIAGWGQPMVSGQLDDYRGGFDIVKNDMQLSGTVANNSAVNVMTGSNHIADGSFTNSSGFPMVIQNSGSNVLIQNATIINLQFK